ncbi:MAG: ATP-binding protein [Elusimicrobia bacterium]|nr:ATP-binding protein [Elusimicrobiota bacterium]
MIIKRHLSHIAFADKLGRQMRFITGPRQAGKTTIAKQQLARAGSGLYYNWDNKELRARYRAGGDLIAADLLKTGRRGAWACFDEIHKMPRWKNILKDYFDAHENKVNFIVTGSARLDMFRSSGDSLSGRYFLFNLNPLTLAEASGASFAGILPGPDAAGHIERAASRAGAPRAEFAGLLKYGGFPEPFLKASGVFHKKWTETYLEQVVDRDLRDLTRIQQLESVKRLLLIMPSKIGSPLSINSIREDLEVNFLTAKNYMDHLCRTCVLFKLPPYSPKIRSLVKKEQKVYFYDWTLAGEEGAKFENYVAAELKARLDLWNDSQDDCYALHFVRSRDGLETDFLIVKNNAPWLLCEAKLSSQGVASHHHRHSLTLGNIPFAQVVLKDDVLKVENKNFFIISASKFFA